MNVPKRSLTRPCLALLSFRPINGIAEAVIALGVAVTMAVRHENHSLTGDRIRVSSKKARKKPSGTREFLVEKVPKDLGASEVAGASG